MVEESIPLKQCSRKEKCINPLGSWLPATAEYFHRHKGRKDGLTNICQVCNRQHVKNWRDENPEQHRASSKRWRIEHPEEARALTMQWLENNPARRAQIRMKSQRKHRLSRNAKERIRRLNNLDRYKARKRAYIEAHPEQLRAQSGRRRARQRGAIGSYNHHDIAILLISQKGLCWWCGKLLDDHYQVDHRIPLARGGSNTPENLVLACEYCNKSRGAKLPQEWGGRLL